MTDPSSQLVLILEDDFDLALQWSAALRLAGFECIIAHTADEAEAWCHRRQFDAIVLDVFIKGEDGRYQPNGGFTLLSHLRQPALTGTPEWGRSVPAIAVSGALGGAGTNTLEYALDMGATSAVAKPIPADRLTARVQHMIAQSRMPGV